VLPEPDRVRKRRVSVGGRRGGTREEGDVRAKFSMPAHMGSSKVLIIILSFVTKQIPSVGSKLLLPSIL
jgi:hypothetical protein